MTHVETTEDLVGADEPMIIVSADTHIGPLLVEQLREYCPKKYLEKFDEYAAAHEEIVRSSSSIPENLIDVFLAGVGTANLDSPGHYDMEARLKELDADGVAAEVVFHTSENGEPIPFRPQSGHFGHDIREDHELAAVGQHMYAQWLADVCSIQPERHVGLVHPPVWDIDASIKELEWARNAGLRAVNFPAIRADVTKYNDPVWDPFWSACEDLDMPLVTHIGGASPGDFRGPGGGILKMLEDSLVFGYRHIHWMVFGGVFERHPNLKVVITEIAGTWLPTYLKDLDDVWAAGKSLVGTKYEPPSIPRPPSEYLMRSAYFGRSMLAPFEAEHTIEHGYVDRIMWGSDYPHMEGTWQYGFNYNGETATRMALRNTFAGLPPETVRQITSDTAIEVYGLDRVALQKVASRIAAPTINDLATRPEQVPEGLSGFAFRTFGTWT